MRGWFVIVGGILTLGVVWFVWDSRGAGAERASPTHESYSTGQERSSVPGRDGLAATLESPEPGHAPVGVTTPSAEQSAEDGKEPTSSEPGLSRSTPEVERLREQGRKLKLALGELRMTDPPLGHVGSAQIAISDAVAILLDLSGQYEAGGTSPLIARPGEHCLSHDGRMYRPKHREFPEFDEIAALVLPRTYAKVFPEIRERQERESVEHGTPGEAVLTEDLRSRIEKFCKEVLLLVP
jgi:hypothetical protein